MSCGCMRKPEEQARGGRKANDLTGRRYGKLTVLKRVENMKGQVMWKCRCDCGKQAEITVSDLNKGNNKSCGCMKIECQKMVRDRLQEISPSDA